MNAPDIRLALDTEHQVAPAGGGHLPNRTLLPWADQMSLPASPPSRADHHTSSVGKGLAHGFDWR